jgi:4-amino-4-deoxy-L-arabinose transferase-like glycosyltransferase
MVKSIGMKIDRLAIIFLLLLGASVRFIRFGQIPPGLYHDEAQNGIDALRILDGEFPIYFEANNGREPLFIYLIALSVGILGRFPLAVRLPSFYAGFLTLAAIYNLARALYDRTTARYAVAVLAVTFWHIHLSRVAFRASLLPLFTALYLSVIVRAIKFNKHYYWIVGGILYGLSWYTYIAARFTPVAIIVLLIYSVWSRRFWKQPFNNRQLWNAFTRFSISALLILLPLGIFTLKFPDIVLTRSNQVSIFNDEINDGDLGGTLIRHSLRAAGMFIVRGDRIWRHNLSYRPVWEAGLSVAFIIGLGLALAGFSKTPTVTLPLLWTAVMLIPTIMAEDAPHYLRAVGVLPTAALLPALGLRWVHDRISFWFSNGATRYLKPILRRLAIHGLPWLLVLSSGITSTYDYFVTYARSALVYHWFEAGPVTLAQTLNTISGQGWNGHVILSRKYENRTVYIDPQLWSSWTAIPFLVPEQNIRFLPLQNPPSNQGNVFVVWPYSEWQKTILPNLSHPTYLYVDEGPAAQGDLDLEPFIIALLIYADPIPPVPPYIAHFDTGLGLRAALVEPSDGNIIVSLWWDTTVTQTTEATVYVHYLRNGIRITQHDGQPSDGQLPTTLWVPGDLILDRHLLPDIIPDLELDRLRIGLYHSDTGENILRVDNNLPIAPWFETNIILKP